MSQAPTSSPPGRASGVDLRRAILDTTRHLLVEEGYNGLSMRKIARAVGCSATSIYLHFENKDALIHALIDEGMHQLHEALGRLPGRGATAAERETLCRTYIDFGLDNPEYYEVMFMLHPERMARYPAEKYRRAPAAIESISAALEDGRRPAPSPSTRRRWPPACCGRPSTAPLPCSSHGASTCASIRTRMSMQ
jgi:AcrR family transcriptional regulator